MTADRRFKINMLMQKRKIFPILLLNVQTFYVKLGLYRLCWKNDNFKGGFVLGFSTGGPNY
jgi:hypothetical protein